MIQCKPSGLDQDYSSGLAAAVSNGSLPGNHRCVVVAQRWHPMRASRKRHAAKDAHGDLSTVTTRSGGKIPGNLHQTFHRQWSQPIVTPTELSGPMQGHDGAGAAAGGRC
jgi:hypothetical protein